MSSGDGCAPDVTRVGCSYFGVRIPRHVRRDMADLAERGYTGVLHTFSENDFVYYDATMAQIVAASHEEGLSGLPRTSRRIPPASSTTACETSY